MVRQLERERVLIADDVPVNIKILTNVLGEKYEVQAVESGEAALDIAQSENPPDIVLLDIRMPGMDGYEVCKRLKNEASTRDIPVIFLTALDGKEEEVEGLRLGAVDYITKPFCPPVVLARVRTHLDLNRRRRNLEHIIHKSNLELRRSNERLRQSEQFLQTLLDHLPLSVYAKMLPEGRYILWNRTLATTSGIASQEALGKTDRDLATPEEADALRRQDERVARTGAIQEATEIQRRAQEDPRLIHTIKVPIPGPDGAPLYILGIAEDVTERKRTEEAILKAIESEQRRIGGDLHDGLVQTLVGVAAMNQFLAKKLTTAGMDTLSITDRIENLMDQAIEQARSLARGLYPVNLEREGFASALQELAEGMQKVYGIPCLFSCNTPFSVASIDMATHLYRIVQEAVSNAIRHGKPDQVVIAVSQEGASKILTIQDDGSGIPAELVSPSSHGGSVGCSAGMGLRTMRYRAELIGAVLRLERLASGGTRVTCSLRSLDT